VTSPDAPGAPPEVRDELVRLLQAHAVEAERLGQVFAGRNGMHPTDLQALLAVMQAEAAGAPLTPGRLGEHLGLSSGATTAVVDRLERADHVRRERDDRDRRRITLHYGAAAAAVGGAFFGPLGARIEHVLAGFTPDELAVVRRFLEQTNSVMRAHREAVTSADAGATGVGAAGAASTAAGVSAAGPGSTTAGVGAAGAGSTAAGVSAAGAAASTDVAAR
jgi:DNA-binding MarR family transcriptional regulator